MEEENFSKKENETSSLNNSSNNKNGIISILIVIIIVLIGAVIYFAFIKKDDKPAENNGGNNQQQNNSNENTTNNNVNTFVYDGNDSAGVAYVTGYAKVIQESNCGSDECPPDEPKDDAVYFYITSTDSLDVKKYLDSFHGDDYKGVTNFRLGCLKNNEISYYNIAEEFYDSSNTGVDNRNNSDNYIKTFSLNNDVTTKIINSNETNPIMLRIEKLKIPFGGHAYSCYSHFAYVEVVE